jgi:hypothetical protein
MARNPDDASSRTNDAAAPPTALAATTQQLTMKRRNNGGLAFATTHQANVVTQHIPEHSAQLNTATINENNRERTTCISDWHPPNVDRLDVAGGLNSGLSEPGN